MRVLLVPNPEKEEAVAAVGSLVARLPEDGHDVVLPEADAAACGQDACAVTVGRFGELDLAVALGGDGTILKAAHLLAGADVPILGVNLGRLGFLSGALLEGLPSAVDDALAGRGTRERRCLLEVRVAAGKRDAGVHDALNEVFVGRGPGGRAVDVSVAVNGIELMELISDGMIVATPTGSTAYSLSAGGPILAPDLRCLVLTPVCPHSLRTRPLVLGPDDQVRLTFPDPLRADASLIIDGDAVQSRQPLDYVDVRLGQHDIVLVRLGDTGFYRSLADTFLRR